MTVRKESHTGRPSSVARIADLATADPRAAAWEARFRTPVLVAAFAVLLLVVFVSSPIVPLALAAAPALRLLVVAKAFKAFKLAKVIKLAKLGKSVRLVRRKLALDGAAEIALAAVALALAAVTVVYMLTDESPLHGSERTIALVVAGVLATFGVSHLHRRRGRDDRMPTAADR